MEQVHQGARPAPAQVPSAGVQHSSSAAVRPREAAPGGDACPDIWFTRHSAVHCAYVMAH